MRSCFLLTCCFFAIICLAQKSSKPAFDVVPLGVKGGLDESNLSAYMVAPAGSREYICFDAGTVRTGIEKAISNKVFLADTRTVLRSYIKGYLVSHAHLDHVSGLIINSPDDTAKSIYALPACMQMLEKFYFNGEAWANFGDEGPGYHLNQYHFNTLQPGIATAIANTSIRVQAFPLSHGTFYESAAFLLNNGDDYVMYLGDTGSDKVEKSDKLFTLWQQVAPLIISKKLKGIFIEVSFPDEQPADKLFGHLTPSLLMEEMEVLCRFTGKKNLENFPVVITHNKPPGSNIEKLKTELAAQNKLGLQLVYPEQGVNFSL